MARNFSVERLRVRLESIQAIASGDEASATPRARSPQGLGLEFNSEEARRSCFSAFGRVSRAEIEGESEPFSGGMAHLEGIGAPDATSGASGLEPSALLRASDRS